MKALLLVLLLCVSVSAQQSAKPDQWRGLVLDQSTPEDSIKALGPPKSDKVEKLLVYQIQSSLSQKCKEKIFRTLEFKQPEGIDKARLVFLNDKLVAFDLDVKKGITPMALTNIYGVEFQPQVSAMDIAFHPRDFEQNQGRVYPKTFPTVYAMVAVSERSMITAMISNVPSFGGALIRSMGIPDQPGTLPGRVEHVMLISRTLENRDGSEALR